VGEHFAGHARGHVELIDPCSIDILPVGDEAYPVRENRRVHQLNLAPKCGLALRGGALYRIAGVVVGGLRPSRRCGSQEKQTQPDRRFHDSPPWWRRM
jgi:hypothetical protein